MPPDGSCTAPARSTDPLTSPFATVTTLTGSPSCVKNRSAANPDGASVSKPAKPDRSAKIVDLPAACNTQSSVPLQSPDQPSNLEPARAVATSLGLTPAPNVALHV